MGMVSVLASYPFMSCSVGIKRSLYSNTIPPLSFASGAYQFSQGSTGHYSQLSQHWGYSHFYVGAGDLNSGPNARQVLDQLRPGSSRAMGKPRRGSATPHYSAGRVGCVQVWELDWATLVIGWSSKLVSGCELASGTAALGFLSS